MALFRRCAAALAALLVGCAPAAAKAPPAKRAQSEVEGRALIGCIVTVAGSLRSCVVKFEDPPGMGFGKAALKLALQFKMRPATRDGMPIEAAVNIPLTFPPPGAPPKTQAERDQIRVETLIAARECNDAKAVAQSLMNAELERRAADCS